MSIIEIDLRHFVILVLLSNVVNCQKYVVSSEMVNWYQAVINCKNAGMELISIHSDEEQNELDKFLKSHGYDKGYWIGATNEGDGKFYWVATGMRMVYTKWLIGQPDNVKVEHCVAWGMPTYQSHPVGWNDIFCTKNLNYICERFEPCFEPIDDNILL